MTVSNLGRWIAIVLFVTGIAAALSIRPSTAQLHLVVLVVSYQIILSTILFIAAKRLEQSKSPAPYKYACWAGILYSLLLSVTMGLRSYEGLGGFSAVLPITSTILFVLVAAPFIWSIEKLKKS